MLNLIRSGLFFITVMILVGDAAAQEKGIKPLAENASITETRRWLIEAIGKNASYKSRVNSATVSNVVFEGCKLSYTVNRKTGSVAQDVMGVTTRVHSAKQEVGFDFSFVEPEGIGLTDHIYPDFQVVTVRFREGSVVASSPNISRDVEIIVKRGSGEAIQSALKRARRLCSE